MEARLNKTWKIQCNTSRIQDQIMKSFSSTNTDLPIFYNLIKTHKQGPTLKIRPIISNRRGPTQKLSWFFPRLLRPLLDSVSAHPENASELLNSIKDLPKESLKKFNYPFSLDVVSLYTSVPAAEAIEIVEEKLTTSEYKNLLPFDSQQVKQILTVIMQNTYFRFKDKVYERTNRRVVYLWAITSPPSWPSSLWTKSKDKSSTILVKWDVTKGMQMIYAF